MKPKMGEKIRYRYENFMAKGGRAVFTSIFVLLLFGVLFSLGLRWLSLLAYPETAREGFFSQFWTTLMEIMDPGYYAEESGSPILLKIVGIIATFIGIVIFSMLIAFITAKLEETIYNFRRGRSRVLESNHTLIVGWNERIVDIIMELVEANESEKKASIVILSEEEKEEMDEYLHKVLGNTKTTKVVTRSGSTSSMYDLKQVNAAEARSAILLSNVSDCSSHEEKHQSDVKVVKTILALLTLQGGENKLNIAAEIFLDENRELFETFESNSIVAVNTQEILGKTLVQTTMSSGLEMVLVEILSFYGSEIYFYQADWDSAPFSELVYRFQDGIPLGICRADGTILLHAPGDATLAKGDELIILASDNSEVNYRKQPLYKPVDHPFTLTKLEKHPRRELILGWHSIAPIIVSEYSDYLVEGSVIDIMFENPSETVQVEIEKLQREHGHININLIPTSPFSVEDLKAVNPFSYDNVIILSQDENDFTAERSDSDTLIILLLLRQIRKMVGGEHSKTKIITQVLNTENQDLIYQSSVDDFIISTKMISTILAQLSEEPRMKTLYDELFGEEGSEIYLKSASLYFDDLPAKVTFADMIRAAQKRGEICMGIQIAESASDPEANFGVKLNPAKDGAYQLTARDCLVVLAEDET